jgi:uncharacterized protein (TIGR02145 family)
VLSAQVPGKVRDIDGNVYKTLTIGKQVWMAENLETTRFSDGISIPWVKDNMEWQQSTGPAYTWYANDPAMKDAYGALYNWHTISSGRLCPAGWHVPSNKEWSELTDFLGGTNMPGTPIQMDGELKSTRTEPQDHPRWDKPNNGATNITGFTAHPAGSRNFAGFFLGLGQFGFWWTSTSQYGQSWYRGMRYDNSDVFRATGNLNNGYSVRCVKD